MNARIDNRSAAAPVRLAGLRKEFENGVVAVHGVDLDIQAGEFVVLVGPSGCGKTTTLRMVAGLESISAGTLTIGGRVVNDVPPAERDIAMVFQTYALYPHMTVRENLGFALRLRKRSRAEIAARVAAAAETLGLTSLLDRTPRQLSGGQRQRVAIGRAIVREPSVFLFDEPLSNLDAALRSEMRRELAALHRTLGATMLYVTHDQVEAMTLGDRIVVMSEGRVRQVDAPSAVYQHPRDTFVAGFLGSPPMNLLSGVLVRGDSRRLVQLAAAPQVRVAMPAQMPDPPSREVILGVRPEHLEVCTEGAGAENERFAATLELAEPLGHEHLLHLRMGDAKLTARCEPAAWPRIGSRLYVRPETDRIHLFDAATGMSLSAGG